MEPRMRCCRGRGKRRWEDRSSSRWRVRAFLRCCPLLRVLLVLERSRKKKKKNRPSSSWEPIRATYTSTSPALFTSVPSPFPPQSPQSPSSQQHLHNSPSSSPHSNPTPSPSPSHPPSTSSPKAPLASAFTSITPSKPSRTPEGSGKNRGGLAKLGWRDWANCLRVMEVRYVPLALSLSLRAS